MQIIFSTFTILLFCIVFSSVSHASSRPADCPSGYKNTGLFCTRGTSDYRAPSRVANCPRGYTNMGADCQKKGIAVWDRKGMSKMSCPRGYFRRLARCYKNCKSGYTNMGETCHRTLRTLKSSSMTCRSNETLDKNTGRCYKQQKFGQGCSIDSRCGPGLSCQPGVHKCYHSPRKAGEACSAGYSCGAGLYCQSFLHKCVAKSINYNSNSPCGALRIQATAEDAKRANITMTFSGGSSGGVGVFSSLETGLVYGNKGEFGCFATACIGQQADASIQNFANFGLYTQYSKFEGFSVVTGAGADVPFIELGFNTSQVWSADPPRSAKNFIKNQLIGTTSGLSFGVGLNPVNVNYAMCYTEVIDDKSPLSGLKSATSTIKQWANAGFAPQAQTSNYAAQPPQTTNHNSRPRSPNRSTPQQHQSRQPNHHYVQAPRGTYQQSCRNVQATKNRLTASCRNRNGKYYAAELNNYNQCRNGIEYSNRRLQCVVKQNSNQRGYQNQPHQSSNQQHRSHRAKRIVTNSFQSVNYPNHYIRHRNYLAVLTPIKSELDRKDATFRVVAGLMGPNSVSFESVNYPGFYLRHQNYALKLQKYDGSELFKKDSSFKKRRALSRGPGYSYESVNFPGYFIRHANFRLMISKNNGSQLFYKDASFKIVNGLSRQR